MLYGSISGMRYFFLFFKSTILLVAIMNNGSCTMTLNHGNLQKSQKRTACGPQPALQWIDLMNFCLVPCALLQRQSLSPFIQPPDV